MTSELTPFTARLREFIASTGDQDDAPANPSAAGADAEFTAFALELFALQFARNTVYRRFCEARGMTPAKVEHWSRIPAVPAAAFKDLELTSLPPEERTTVFHSSGTTGQRPSRHFHSAESLALYEASLWSWFQQNALRGLRTTPPANRSDPVPGHTPEVSAPSRWRMVFLTPPPESAPHSSLVHMFETVRHKCAANEGEYVGAAGSDGAWILDVARAETSLRRAVEAGEPVVVLGTAFGFVHLLDGLEARGVKLTLPAGSRVMETGGYKGRSRELPKTELHALIEARLAVPRSHIICEYGMSELSSQAYDGIACVTGNARSENRIYRFPPWCRVQVISPETGGEVRADGTGLIRVLDLANVFSVMAVQTEDLAVRRAGGFVLIGRAVAAEPRGCSLMAT